MHDEATVLGVLLAWHGLERPVLIGHSDGASIAGIEAARDAYETGDLRARLARHHDDVDAAFRGWNDVWLSPAFRTWDITSYLRAIACPMLLVQCPDDPYGTLAQLDAIESGVRGPVERLVLPGDSHSPQVDHPDQVVDAITNFVTAALSTNPSRTGTR